MAAFTHPTDASLGHPLFAARKEGKASKFYNRNHGLKKGIKILPNRAMLLG
jgi:hypothetical protein